MLMAQEETLLGVKDAGLFVGMAEALEAALNLGTEKIGDLQTQQFRSRKSTQPLGHGIGVVDLLRLRIKQKERVPGFFEQGHGQFVAGIQTHGVISRSHVNSSTLSIQTLPSPPK